MAPVARLVVLNFMTFWFATFAVAQDASVADSTVVTPASESDDGITWYTAQDIGVEGRAWDDTASYFDRLPARAKALVRPPVWSLSLDSAGMAVPFVTDATAIHARWKLKKTRLAMDHMPATGVSGVDLYVRHQGKLRWLAVGRPKSQDNDQMLVDKLSPERREYLLYLPLYNGVTELQIGVPTEAKLWRRPREKKQSPDRLLGNIDHSWSVCLAARHDPLCDPGTPIRTADHQLGFFR